MGFRGVKKNFNWCLREVSKVLQGSFQGVTRKFLVSRETFKRDSRELQGYLREVEIAFKESFRDFLRKFQGCLKNDSSVFHKSFKKVSRLLQ